MKALILNTQVCQIEKKSFEVAKPLYWVDCSDNVTTEWTYVESIFVAPIIPIATAEKNKTTASSLLLATDWTTIADVADPINSPYLINQSDFIAYRNEIRKIAVNPIAGNLVWAEIPKAIWL